MSLPREISVTELAAWRADSSRPAPLLLDVRNHWEFDLVALPDSTLVPLDELEAQASELPRDRPIACLCHHGVRSLNAALYLAELGFEATSVRGGIDAWSLQVDARVARY
jgi:rhodanese-related sulfurtransferase